MQLNIAKKRQLSEAMLMFGDNYEKHIGRIALPPRLQTYCQLTTVFSKSLSAKFSSGAKQSIMLVAMAAT